MPKINSALTKTDTLNAYSDAGHKRKLAFHNEGKKFLAKIAAELGLSSAAYDLRNNEAGAAVSGEVTLHTDTFYMQLSEGSTRRGVSMLYRSCKGRKDYCGGQNNTVAVKDLEDDTRYARLLQTCQNWMGAAA